MNRILVVDDEKLNINVLNDLLKTDYKVMAAINGEQALKAASSANKPDLILLDIMMPEMDGYEVCRRLKENAGTKDIPVIFVTAMGQTSDETKGLELGAADYLTKPISPPIVQARVKTQINLRQQQKELKDAYNLIESQKLRMEDELNVAKDIQLSMLPQVFPKAPEFNLHALMNAAREVGGDFYDFFFIDEDNICLVVGDVSGKGVPAALFMAITKSMIKSRATDDLSTASIVTHVNDEISLNNESSMFITIFLAILNIKTGELTYTNAGHNYPFVKHQDGKLQKINDRHGPVAGAVKGFAYKESRTMLAKDDLFFLYTDGVTEAMNSSDELFDDHRLEKILVENIDQPVDLNNRVRKEVLNFENGADQTDDVTILSLLYNGFSSEKCDALKVKLENDISELERFENLFCEFCERISFPKNLQLKMAIVFDEMLNNIISYGFNDKDEHEIEVIIDLLNDRLKITIIDDGIPFNPLSGNKVDTTSSLEDRELGGLGIHFMKEFSDKYYYRRGVNKNILILIKNILA